MPINWRNWFGWGKSDPAATASYAQGFAVAPDALTPEQRVRWAGLRPRLQAVVRSLGLVSPGNQFGYRVYETNLAVRILENPGLSDECLLQEAVGIVRDRSDVEKKIEENELFAKVWTDAEAARNTGKRFCDE